MGISILSIVDDPANESEDGDKKDGGVGVPAREELGDLSIKLLDYARHSCKGTEDGQVRKQTSKQVGTKVGRKWKCVHCADGGVDYDAGQPAAPPPSTPPSTAAAAVTGVPPVT